MQVYMNYTIHNRINKYQFSRNAKYLFEKYVYAINKRLAKWENNKKDTPPHPFHIPTTLSINKPPPKLTLLLNLSTSCAGVWAVFIILWHGHQRWWGVLTFVSYIRVRVSRVTLEAFNGTGCKTQIIKMFIYWNTRSGWLDF